MQIKLIIDVGKMSDQSKDLIFNKLEDLATRDLSDQPIAVQCNNIFDGRKVGKNLYFLFGELEDKDLIDDYIHILGHARNIGARFVIFPGKADISVELLRVIKSSQKAADPDEEIPF